MTRLEKNLMRLFALLPCSLWAVNYPVTLNGPDDGTTVGTLRWAMLQSNVDGNASNTITFAPGIGAIVLNPGLGPLPPLIPGALVISKNVTITTQVGQAPQEIDNLGFTVFPGGSAFTPPLAGITNVVTINNVLLAGSIAQGGQGGGVETGGTGGSGGGGGAGLGGGLFVGAGSTVTISSLSFQFNQALGGAGGSGSVAVIGGGGGGGGGLGAIATGGPSAGSAGISGGGGGGGIYGAGGVSGNNNAQGGGGGGGALGTGADNDASSNNGGGGGGYPTMFGNTGDGGPGATAGIIGGGLGGSNSSGAAGTAYGGGGGGGGNTATGSYAGGAGGIGGGGGGSGASGMAGPINETGGAGGYGGGGGGAGPAATSLTGGAGGVGGGGGGAGIFNGFGQGGVGGFGGGGGGSSSGLPSNPNGSGGLGGFGGGIGGGVSTLGASNVGGGGGGAAFGGAIFIDNTGTLMIEDGCSFSGNSVTGGIGGAGAGTGGLGGTSGTAAGVDIFLNSGGQLTFDLTTTLALTNPIVGGAGGGTGGLTMTGSGTLDLTAITITGPNTYTGTTTVTSGTLAVSADSNLGVSTNPLVIANGTLSLANGFAAPSSRTTTLTGSATLSVSSGSATWGAVITGGSGSLTTAGAGKLILTGANTYGGTTTISAGTLSIGAAGQIIPLASNVTIGSTGTLDLSSFSQTINSLSGLGQVTLGGNTLTTGNSNSTYGGVITGTGGSLIKVGTGTTFTLTGANNYTGATTISAGILRAGAVGVVPAASDMTISSTGIFDLAGENQTIGSLTGVAGSQVMLGGAQLTTGDTLSTTFGGVISLTGSLVKEGTGTFTLSGLNTYVGTTTISAGTLHIGASGQVIPSNSDVTIGSAGTLDLSAFSQTIHSLAGLGQVTLGGNTLTTGSVVSTIYGGVITGTGGSLTKAGTGTFTLTGLNNYTGTTTINTGTLSVGAAAQVIPIASAMVIGSAGTFNLAGNNQTVSSLSGLGQVTLGGGQLTTGSTGNATYGGVISQAGSLIKIGTGTFTLSGLNTYGGTTTISAGTLSIGASGQIIPINSDVTIGSAGTLDVSGFGQTISSLSGLGQVTLGAHLLTTGNSENTTYGGVISDGGLGGQLTKQGSGIFTLTGTNTYIGLTNVMAGTLVVNGSIMSGVTVAPGATLRGSGTINGNVTANGTVFPGSSIGTLAIVGNYTQGTGSTFIVELTPSTTDLLTVTGTATIDTGATLLIMPDPGTYPMGEITYRIIEAGGGVTGTFSSVQSTVPTLALTVVYLPNEVDLTFVLPPPTPPSPPLVTVTTGNAGVVARAIACIQSNNPPPAGSDLASLFAELGTLSLSPLEKALNQLQPAFYKNFILAQQENTIHVREGFTNRLEVLFEARCPKNRTYSKEPYGVWEEQKRPSMFWGNAIGYASDQGGSGERSGYEATTGGFIAGFDYAPSDHFVCGLGGAYTYTHVDIKQSHGDGHINSYYGSLYSSWFGKHFFFDGVLMYGFDQFDESRKIHFGTIHRRARTEHNGNQFTAHLDGGVIFQLGRAAQLLPFLSADYLFLHEQGFSESGAKSLDLRVDHSDDTLLRSEGGLRFTTCVVKKQSKWIPELSVSAIRESRFNGRHYRAHFKGEPCALIVRGLYPDRTLFSPVVSLTGLLCDDQLSLSLRYEGEFGQRYQNNLGSLRLGWLF